MRYKGRLFFSIRHKITLTVLFSSMTVLFAVSIATPIYITRKLLTDIEVEIKNDVGFLIARFIKDSRVPWGTVEAAREFSRELSINYTLLRYNSEMESTPFRLEERIFFSLTDMNRNKIWGLPNYNVGDFIPYMDLNKYLPIKINNQAVAYIAFIAPPPLEKDKEAFLAFIRTLMRIGFGLAFCVALVSGAITSLNITRSLSYLTKMAENLAIEGISGQRIEGINTRDEVERLADVFNEMSLELDISHKKIKELAIRDGLTGLYNRRFFMEQAKNIVHNSHRYNHIMTLVLGDVDFFKKVNDNFSHTVGDSVLIQVSSILLNNLREADIIARYGGEEFIIILPETDSANSIEIIERLRFLIETYDWEGIAENLKITMSFGLCTKLSPESCQDMIELADKNLYIAKDSGRNRVIS